MHREHILPAIWSFPLQDKPIVWWGYRLGEGNCCWTLPDLGTCLLVLVFILVLCASMLEFVCAFCVGICLHLLCFGVIKLVKVGNTTSIPKENPLGHILDKWAKHSHEPMTKKDMIYYCNKVWTQYMLSSEG